MTVTAEHDGDSANEAQVTLTHTVASTDDSTYNGLAADSVTVDVTDDDTDGVTVSPTEVTVTEGLTAEYTVVLDTQPTGNVTVTINDPTDNTDVTADPASLTFNTSNWSTAQTVTVSAIQDDDADDETATITHEVTGYGSVTAANVDVTLEDDAPESLVANFSEASYAVAEIDDPDTTDVTENEVVVTVTLSADPERTVTIPLTTTHQDGASSADYSGVPASVVFNSGDTEKEFTFTATADNADDDGESVLLGFDTLPDGVSAGDNATATVNITDDDDPAVTVRFEQNTYTAAEGAGVTVKLLLSAAPEREVEITLLKANQDGATSSDYSGVPSTVTFSSTDTEKEFTFSATADDVDDDGESVKLGFGSPLPTGVTEGSTNETVVSITDNDDPSVTVSFEQGTYTVAEGGTVAVKVKLSADPERTVTIPITKDNQDGASSGDYSGVPTTVTFNSGDTEKEFTFSATQDTAG